MSDTAPRRVPPATIAGLLVAAVAPPLFVIIPNRVFGEARPLALQLALQAAYCLLPVFIVWLTLTRERLPLGSLGLRRPDWTTVAWGLGLCLVALFVLPVLEAPLMNAVDPRVWQRSVDQLAALPAWFRLVVGITGGIVEELLSRGYGIERLTLVVGRRWLAAVISVAAFAIAHVPMWGLGFALAADLPFGLLMTTAYLCKRDLTANMLAHSLTLVVQLLTIGR